MLRSISERAEQNPFKRIRDWSYRFLSRHRLSIQRITRNVALTDEELTQRSVLFLGQVNRHTTARPGVVFINMDQTAIEYQMKPLRTIDVIGAKSVISLANGQASNRVTAVLTACSDGTKLKPMIIFKGTVGWRISRELRSPREPYPDGAIYAVQANAWMDETTMLDWIQR